VKSELNSIPKEPCPKPLSYTESHPPEGLQLLQSTGL
jgi:hypothetical protein